MKFFTSKRSSIHTLLNRSLFLSSFTVFIVAILTTSYFLNKKAQRDYIKQEQQGQNVLATHLIPSLSISNYLEAQRLLGHATNESNLSTVLSPEGDFILSDYTLREYFTPLLPKQLDLHGCSSLLRDHIELKGKSYVVLCRDLSISNQGTGQALHLGSLISLKYVDKIQLNWMELLSMLLLLLFIIALSSFLIRFFISKRILSPVNRLLKELHISKFDIFKKQPAFIETAVDPIEFKELRKTFHKLLSDLHDEIDRHDKTKQDAYYVSLSRQIAHDIRSPLAALEVATKDLSALDENIRIIIRSATQRIKDIANCLILKASKKTGNSTRLENQEQKPHHLCSIIESVLTEKRIQFRPRLGLAIKFEHSENAYGLFATFNLMEFKRVLSNLVNNAVEAIDGPGVVDITVSGVHENIVLTIQDTGQGIPKEILKELGEEGKTTFNKKEGSGLGLYHAKTQAKQWGGHLQIRSKMGKGTTVTITMKKTNPPNWFVSTLNLYPTSQLVILDDDISIHHIWKHKFLHKDSSKIELVSFSNNKDFRKWVKESPSLSHRIYLCDYELLGEEKTGLDIIQDMNLTNHAFLVTSRFEEEDLIKQCESIGMKMIPKPMVSTVPIIFQKTKNDSSETIKTNDQRKLNVLVVDDDQIIRTSWEVLKHKYGIHTLYTYSSYEALITSDIVYSNISIAFVDNNLEGSRFSGAQVIEHLRNKGVKKVILASGDNSADLKKSFVFKYADSFCSEKIPSKEKFKRFLTERGNREWQPYE